MLIPCRYVKNRSDVYGSIFTRGVADVDRIFAVYAISFVEDRFESKGFGVCRLRYSKSHTRLGMNRYAIWKTRVIAVLVARRCLYWFARKPFCAIKTRFGAGFIVVNKRNTQVYTRTEKVIYLVQRLLSNFIFIRVPRWSRGKLDKRLMHVGIQ